MCIYLYTYNLYIFANYHLNTLAKRKNKKKNKSVYIIYSNGQIIHING
jgi:hypothetical protein